MTVYISGDLTNTNGRQKLQNLESFIANVCATIGFQAYFPHADIASESTVTDESKTVTDLHRLRNSDAIIAVLGDDSFRCGAELAIAIQLGIPIYALLAATQDISRFPYELLEDYPGASIIRYNDVFDVAAQLVATLTNVPEEDWP